MSSAADKGDSVKGKAMFDFEASEDKEISVLAGQV